MSPLKTDLSTNGDWANGRLAADGLHGPWKLLGLVCTGAADDDDGNAAPGHTITLTRSRQALLKSSWLSSRLAIGKKMKMKMRCFKADSHD